MTGATCVESDDSKDQVSLDLTDPPSGDLFYYLVRAENGCVMGAGPPGTSSLLNPRAGRDCS